MTAIIQPNNIVTTTLTTTINAPPVVSDKLNTPPAYTNGATTSIGAFELSENFYIQNKRKGNLKIQVKLNNDGVYLRREMEQSDEVNEQLIRLVDIIGSYCGPRLKKQTHGGLTSCKRNIEGDPDELNKEISNCQKDTSAYLYIYAYVKREKPLRRNRTVRILRFRSSDQYEENLNTAQRWHRIIRIHKFGPECEMNSDKQFLILLNPKSGSGKGREMFQKQVVPVLKEVNIPYELLVTTHPNYARDLIRTRTDLLQRYKGIIVASGDGLFYEVLNGMMERPDWQRVCHQLPIGIIPCGSGNGLAKSIAHYYNEPYDPKPILYSTLTCVAGKSAPMDIVRINIAKGAKQQEMYSFLSVGWGIIADIDIESERLRSIGAPRFTIWSIHRLISLRTYKGKLSYIPWQKSQHSTETQTPLNSNPETGQRSKFLTPENIRESQDEFHDLSMEHDDDDDDNFADIISLDHKSPHSHSDSWHSAVSKRTAYYSFGDQSIRSRRSNASMWSKIEMANAALKMQPPPSTIPPLNEPIPNDIWHSEEGEYVMVQAAYTSHLAADVLFAPDSQLNDGVIYLVIIRAGVGRSQLMQFLLNLDTGTHLPLPNEPNEHIQIKPVRAFRIEPTNEDGIITVDGERVDYGPIQGEVLPGMIQVMVPNGK